MKLPEPGSDLALDNSNSPADLLSVEFAGPSYVQIDFETYRKLISEKNQIQPLKRCPRQQSEEETGLHHCEPSSDEQLQEPAENCISTIGASAF